MHKKVDPNDSEVFTTYPILMLVGAGCGGNMKVVRDWRLLDWCTQRTYTYTQVIKAVDDKAPTFGVKGCNSERKSMGDVASYNVTIHGNYKTTVRKAEELS